MRRTPRLVALAACCLLAGCAVLNVLALPFKLLFNVFEAIGSGIGSLADSVAFLDVHEGPAPRLVALGGGRFTVEGLQPASRFDVVLSAPGHASRRYRWPEDLAGRPAASPGAVEVTCVLPRRTAPAPASDPR